MNANPLDRQVFSSQVSSRFGRHAAGYARHARLQQGVAWRRAHLCAPLHLAAGPRADLGAGSGTGDVDEGAPDDDEAGGASASNRSGGTMRRRCGSI
jgi:hypothetical protein